MAGERAPRDQRGRLTLLCGAGLPDDPESLQALAGEGTVAAGTSQGLPGGGLTAGATMAARGWLAEMFPGLDADAELARPPARLGAGLLHAVPVVTACTAAVPGSRLFLFRPETHLSARAQSVMGRLACATAAAVGVQVTVVTHSDHIFNNVRLSVRRGLLPAGDTEIRYYAPGPGNSVDSPRIGSDGMVSHWPAGFFDEHYRTIDELLGEGPVLEP